VHPKNKRDVGNRLAHIALKKVYKKDVVYSGPVFNSLNREANKLKVFFDYVGDSLKINNGKTLAGFELIDESGNRLPATATIKNNVIGLFHPNIENPVGLCYGWAPFPNCNLVNSAELPALPFRAALPGYDIVDLMNKNRITIIGFGDSITKGYRPGVRLHQTFCALLERDLRELGFNVIVTNIGKGRERTDQALDRLINQVVSRNPDIVLLMYGTNDSHIDVGKDSSRLDIDKYKVNLHELIKKLREANIQPVLMTEPRMTNSAKAKENEPYASNDMNFMLQDYVNICQEIAKEEKVEFVDHFQIWTKSEKAGQNLDEWLTDGVHPNPEGHKKIAEAILPVLLKTLK